MHEVPLHQGLFHMCLCFVTAMHDSIAAAIHQCHRLIIVLSPEAKYPTDTDPTEETLPSTCDDQIHTCYEHKVGIYNALTQNDPQVILVEIGERRPCWTFVFTAVV